jgi:hypothetical protein
MQPAMAREKRNASDDFRIFIRYLICGDAVSKMNFVFGPIRFSWTAAFGRFLPVATGSSRPEAHRIHLGIEASISLCRLNTLPLPNSSSSFNSASSRLSATTVTRFPTLVGVSQITAMYVFWLGCISMFSGPTSNDCFWPNLADRLSIAGRRAGKVADYHVRLLPTQSRHYRTWLTSYRSRFGKLSPCTLPDTHVHLDTSVLSP